MKGMRLFAPFAMMLFSCISVLAQDGEYISTEYFRRLHEPYTLAPGIIATVPSVRKHHFDMAQAMSKSHGIVEELAFITTSKYYRYFGAMTGDITRLFLKQSLYAIPHMRSDERFVTCLLLMSRELQGEGAYLKTRTLSFVLNSCHLHTGADKLFYSRMSLPELYDLIDISLLDRSPSQVAHVVGEKIFLPTSQTDLAQCSNTTIALCLLSTERDLSDQSTRTRSVIRDRVPAELLERSDNRRSAYEGLAKKFSAILTPNDLQVVIRDADPRLLSWLFQDNSRTGRHENLEETVHVIIDTGSVEQAAAVFQHIYYSLKSELSLGKGAEERFFRKTCIISDGDVSLNSRICAMLLRYRLLIERGMGASSLEVVPLDYEGLYSLYGGNPDPLVAGAFSKLVSVEGSSFMQGEILRAAQRGCVQNPCFSSIMDYVISNCEESPWDMMMTGLAGIVP